jgi:hypothetical protein
MTVRETRLLASRGRFAEVSHYQRDEPDNTGRLDFEAVEPVDPTMDQLKEYAGRYVSDELAASDRLMVRDGWLLLRVNIQAV